MRARSKLVGLLKRVRSLHRGGRPSIREDFFPQCYVRQLEQRRVLSVNVNAGADQTDVNEGEVVALESATFTDQAISHTAEIDWGDGITEAGTVDELFGTVAGSHIYADNGIYTVTVRVSDTDSFGETGEDTFSVTVGNIAPSLTVAENQMVDEGTLLDITFTDPGFDNPHNTGGELSESFFFSVDWGDGTGPNFGVPTIDTPGRDDVPTAGSFGHIYADNGLYTVTVTVLDDDGGMAVDTLTVTVDNVAPSLNVADDPEPIYEGDPLDIVRTFTDPGFDNPLNIGGELVESFVFNIDWGDGTGPNFGVPMIDTPGRDGVPTAGLFEGSHYYADNGLYTVTVTVLDDDGGMAVDTLTVTVKNVAPLLNVADDPEPIYEGDPLDIVRTFTDPGFDNPLNVGGELVESFFFNIDWGDGTGPNFGVPTIDMPGRDGVPTAGSFEGSHIYADNGLYTVTVTVLDDDGGMAVDTLTVTVDNVAPSLTVPGDRVLFQNELLDITDIGVFTDPGFDNPLNIGGELIESFVFNIDWGDGMLPSFGVPTIDTPGGLGVLTAGSFDGNHSFAAGGTFTVTVTVFDDDGGSDSATFEVFVIAITVPPVGALPSPGGALADLTLPELIITPEPPRNFTEPLGTSDFRPSRSIASPVAEKSYVLRVVSPIEKEGDDVPLKDDVLDHLAELFAKLPDDHYRIYLIRADGTERLVLDFQIRGGRPIDPADAAEQLRDLPPQPMAKPNVPADTAENTNENDKQSHVPPAWLGDIETAIASAEVSADNHPDVSNRSVPQHHSLTVNPVVFGGTSIGTAATAIVYARGTSWQQRVDRAMQQPSPRPITKAARLCRRIRQADIQDRVS